MERNPRVVGSSPVIYNLHFILIGSFGDLAYEKKGASLTATDILDEIAITTDLMRKIPSSDIS